MCPEDAAGRRPTAANMIKWTDEAPIWQRSALRLTALGGRGARSEDRSVFFSSRCAELPLGASSAGQTPASAAAVCPGK